MKTMTDKEFAGALAHIDAWRGTPSQAFPATIWIGFASYLLRALWTVLKELRKVRRLLGR